MPPAGFKTTLPASEWLQTHALDHMATGIGFGLVGQENVFGQFVMNQHLLFFGNTRKKITIKKINDNHIANKNNSGSIYYLLQTF